MTAEHASQNGSGLVGSSVRSTETRRLVLGNGRFLDDISLPGMAHAHIVRSPVASGTITSVTAPPDDALPEGAFMLHALDEHGLAHIPCVRRQPTQSEHSYPVLSAEVRYVGQPIGIAVASSRAAAEDLAEMYEFDIATRPVVRDAMHGLEPGAPVVSESLSDNLCFEATWGDSRAEIDELAAAAAHVVRRRLRIQRVTPSPLEPRGVLASWDGALQRLTAWMSTQAPHHSREHLSEVLDLSMEQIRVVAPDLGGGFGAKEHLYPDEALVCAAAMRTGRPVKWVEDRFESFTATMHARDQIHEALLALDADGRFIALWTDFVHDMGAHPSNVGVGPDFAGCTVFQGPYVFDRVGARFRGVLSNRTPTGSYRGFGQQQATWVRERLVDEAARELGMDPLELRRMNMIPADAMPFDTRVLSVYDSGDYPAALATAIETVRALPARPDDGRRRGVGFAYGIEATGLAPTVLMKAMNFHLTGYETAVARLESDGSATVLAGAVSMGQGIETTLAQIVGDALHLPVDRVRVILGDSDRVPFSSGGSIASRSIAVGGAALSLASGQLRGRIIQIAAHMLEAAPEDIELGDGRASVRGAPSKGISYAELSQSAWKGWNLPAGMSAGMEETATHDPKGFAYAYAVHAAAVAVDVHTGRIEVEDYVVVADSGVLVNPAVADGQLIGGVAQGLGMALGEEIAYDDGVPRSSTFMDYRLPVASEVPDISVTHLCVPAPDVPGGMKGLGESGVIPSPAAVGNAVCDAVPEIAEAVTATPLGPGHVWRLMEEAGVSGGHDG